jgi:hypothetical protein
VTTVTVVVMYETYVETDVETTVVGIVVGISWTVVVGTTTVYGTL